MVFVVSRQLDIRHTVFVYIFESPCKISKTSFLKFCDGKVIYVPSSVKKFLELSGFIYFISYSENSLWEDTSISTDRYRRARYFFGTHAL